MSARLAGRIGFWWLVSNVPTVLVVLWAARYGLGGTFSTLAAFVVAGAIGWAIFALGMSKTRR